MSRVKSEDLKDLCSVSDACWALIKEEENNLRSALTGKFKRGHSVSKGNLGRWYVYVRDVTTGEILKIRKPQT